MPSASRPEKSHPDSGAELPALISRVLSNELATGIAVTQAIREWQPDYLRP